MTRLFDIFLSLSALLILFPFLAPISILLLCTGEKKVFYKQERIGKDKKPFELLKFATMLEDSPNLPGGDITSGDDPRVLPAGRILRKTKINELPQLINILRGEISIVGPRPLTPKNFAIYSEEVQETIAQVKPGLSGIGSIVFRDEESIISKSERSLIDCYHEEITPYKGKLEEWYVKRKNIFLYFVIILITGWIVLFPKSNIVWKCFLDLPKPPRSLAKNLNSL
jgi:lipopolysaccharide/colanic/teichoic acid biosynthesis glycosyltransferase